MHPIHCELERIIDAVAPSEYGERLGQVVFQATLQNNLGLRGQKSRLGKIHSFGECCTTNRKFCNTDATPTAQLCSMEKAIAPAPVKSRSLFGQEWSLSFITLNVIQYEIQDQY